MGASSRLNSLTADKVKPPHCLIVGSTVTALCEMGKICEPAKGMGIQTTDANFTSISGTLTTSNIIMANWSKEMWQGVVNRAVRYYHRVRLVCTSPRHLPTVN
ncbi:hypothetical protein KIN20_031071 [Parelaphostrongylus tenuis]|uniref:Uncharacterized protein n=1 Tax=Parelaphostrongylus tenuis TaxID=148309 RepID=A0AAD5R4M3_PARTN|nr:hypothetical protein KIN20_031071 [Parelaphostrongylus tenuis]